MGGYGHPGIHGLTDGAGRRRRLGRAAVVLGKDVLPRLALLYLLVVCSMEWLNRHLIFHPARDHEAAPGELGLAWEDVTFPAADGPRLHGWFFPADDPRGTVLFCHGNAGNISHRLDTVEQLRRLRLSVLLFDYRGYGRSEGTPSEAGVYRDAEAAWRYLTGTRGIPPGRVLVHGRSLGGCVAAHLARDHTPAGLIVESAFADITDLGAELYRWLPVRWLSRVGFVTEDYVRTVRCPVLVVHSREDDMIGFHHARRIHAAAPQPKRLLPIQGPHNGSHQLSEETYLPALETFADETLDGDHSP